MPKTARQEDCCNRPVVGHSCQWHWFSWTACFVLAADVQVEATRSIEMLKSHSTTRRIWGDCAKRTLRVFPEPCYAADIRIGQRIGMIIKEADDKNSTLDALKGLLARSDCKHDTKKRIEQEIRNIQAGIRGEDEAAYEIKVHWGESKNWMAIHDLRIEHGGLVAQIDHLLINRFLEMWVCESKHFSEGIAINEHGEFAAFFGGKPYGVPSPIEQNIKHILILKKLFDSGAVKLPTRLGFTIKPDLKSLVLVSKGARISRPKAKIESMEAIIKNDQVFRYIDKTIDQSNNPLMMAKIVGQDTLEALAREIAKLHKPIAFDWSAKFGLPKEQPAISLAKPEPPPARKAEAATPELDVAQTASEQGQKPKQKLVCHSCGASVGYNVAKFCWFNKPKFGGNIYCMDCQKTVSAA